MNVRLVWIAVIIGQMNTLQDKPVVHLKPNSSAIQIEFGGQQLDLLHAPAIISLPLTPPRIDSEGNPWSIDIKNLGPGVVTVVGKNQFNSRIAVGQTVHVFSNGRSYSLR